MGKDIKPQTCMNKKAFVFFGSWYKAIKDQPIEIKLEIIEATVQYGLTGIVAELSPVAKIAFGFIKNDIDRNNQTYEKVSKQRSEAGKKGNEIRWGNHSQEVAKNDNSSQSIANHCTESQNIASVRKPSQSSLKEEEKDEKNEKDENKKISLSLTPSPSDLQLKQERNREKEREDFIFKILFWLNKKSPYKETRRLIDNYQSQGWKKANGRDITDIGSVVRMWKCEDDGVRMPRKHLEILRKMLESVNLHENANALREIEKLVPNGDNLELFCTRKVGNYLQEHSQALKPVSEKYFDGKKLLLKYID